MLAPWKKSYDQPRQHIKKWRHFFANKCPSSQSYGFQVVRCGCESWTIRKAEWRTEAFDLWCWRRLLEISLDSKEIQPVNLRGNQSWIFSGKTDLEAEVPDTLTTWYKELTHCKRPWCRERPKAGGEEDDRLCDGWMASPTRWTWVWASSRSWCWTGRPGMLQSMGSQSVSHDWAPELNWKPKKL